jgi:hypothetical protein
LNAKHNSSGHPEDRASTNEVDAQLDIFTQYPRWTPDSPAGKFEAYHLANPQVWDCLVREARRWKRERPGARLGINLLIGRVRWVLTVHTNSTGDGFRINDHSAPFYARLLMHRCPDLDGLFALRSSWDADEWIADIKATESSEAA